jgi:hypothetical protein
MKKTYKEKVEELKEKINYWKNKYSENPTLAIEIKINQIKKEAKELREKIKKEMNKPISYAQSGIRTNYFVNQKIYPNLIKELNDIIGYGE